LIRRLISILALAIAALAQSQAPGPTRQGGRFIAFNYGQWVAQVLSFSSGVACVQPITFTLGDGSVLKPWNTNASLRIGQETVTPTAFDFQSKPGQVCISATFASPHFPGDQVSSGSFGLQEALNTAGARGGGAVTIDQNWAGLGGTDAIKNAAFIPANVAIEDVRNGITGGGGGAVSSVFGRTGAVSAQSGDYTFAQIASTPTTIAGYGITDAVNNTLSNLGTTAINSPLLPNSAGAFDFGSAIKPWRDLWLAGSSGTPASNNFRFTGTPTGARVVTIPDATFTIAQDSLVVHNTGTESIAGAKTFTSPISVSSGHSIGLGSDATCAWEQSAGALQLCSLSGELALNNNNTGSRTVLYMVSPASGIVHATGSGGETRSSPVDTTDLASGAVTSAKLATANTYRTCMIVVGADNGSVLTSADLGPQNQRCFIPYAATVVEITVFADAGTPSVIVRKNALTNLLSSALATAASGAVACANTGGTIGLNGATTCSATLQNTDITAGATIGLASGTADGTAKRMSIAITFTVN
jgi:hypothetical protein